MSSIRSGDKIADGIGVTRFDGVERVVLVLSLLFSSSSYRTPVAVARRCCRSLIWLTSSLSRSSDSSSEVLSIESIGDCESICSTSSPLPSPLLLPPPSLCISTVSFLERCFSCSFRSCLLKTLFDFLVSFPADSGFLSRAPVKSFNTPLLSAGVYLIVIGLAGGTLGRPTGLLLGGGVSLRLRFPFCKAAIMSPPGRFLW